MVFHVRVQQCMMDMMCATVFVFPFYIYMYMYINPVRV